MVRGTTKSGDDERVEHSGGIQASLSGRYATALFELARDEISNYRDDGRVLSRTHGFGVSA